MKLGNLKPGAGARKDRKRIGRGPASGTGKTSGRGNKGYHSRSGSKRRPWFEGGQMPLQRRVPKRGFSNARFKKVFQVVNIGRLAELSEKDINVELMAQKGLIRTNGVPVKVLGNGDIKNKIKVSAHSFSATAKEKIEKAGGQAIVI
ncbi:MAG: 50S ribosomal protein L15 [Fidelibacterota bacterium]